MAAAKILVSNRSKESDQFVRMRRFDDVAIGPVLSRPFDVRGLIGCRKNHHHQLPPLSMLANEFQYFQAWNFRHSQIEQQKAWERMLFPISVISLSLQIFHRFHP